MAVVYGGVVLALPPEPVDVLVQGYTRYANASIKGGQFRMSYPGRWVVRYDLAVVGRFSSSRRLLLSVDRPGWPNLSFMLTDKLALEARFAVGWYAVAANGSAIGFYFDSWVGLRIGL